MCIYLYLKKRNHPLSGQRLSDQKGGDFIFKRLYHQCVCKPWKKQKCLNNDQTQFATGTIYSRRYYKCCTAVGWSRGELRGDFLWETCYGGAFRRQCHGRFRNKFETLFCICPGHVLGRPEPPGKCTFSRTGFESKIKQTIFRMNAKTLKSKKTLLIIQNNNFDA